jgi:dihydroorotate dehydrogenase
MFWQGIILNAVGLSGPGAKALLDTGRWQKRTKPFGISFMAVGLTREERAPELAMFVKLLKKYLPQFAAKIFLQINYSCPNVGLNPSLLIDEVISGLKLASYLGIPLMPKFNILAPIEALKEISKSPWCDAICVSNTIPWGKLAAKINWKKLFGSDISPLAGFGGGGLSGAPLLLLVAEYVEQMRNAGITKPINAGGGILSPGDVDLMHHVGASSVFIGSVATLRPWRVQPIIQRTHQLFGNARG